MFYQSFSRRVKTHPRAATSAKGWVNNDFITDSAQSVHAKAALGGGCQLPTSAPQLIKGK